MTKILKACLKSPITHAYLLTAPFIFKNTPHYTLLSFLANAVPFKSATSSRYDMISL